MRWAAVGTAVALAGLAALAGAVALRRGDGRPRSGSRLRVVFTGEALGELEPCNCSGNEAGGLPALGGFVASQGRDALRLDVGCLGRGAREFERLRLQAVLRGMAKMSYDAVNVAEHELWLGKDGLMALFPLGVPFTSANVVDAEGKPVARPFVVVRRGGLKAAVTGLVASGPYAAGPGLRVEDPREALARLLPAMRREAGVVVVLADLEPAAVEALVRDFPEITLVLCRGRGDSRPPERLNRSIVASVSGQVRFAGNLELSWDHGLGLSAAGLPVALDERFPPSAEVAEASIAWYKDAIRGRRFDLAEPRPGWRRLAPSKPPEGDRYAGSAACRSCHEVSWAAWEKSHHRRAMASLEKAGYEFSPECVVCHVVGYGATDGYPAEGGKSETRNSKLETRNPEEELASVGCEGCHGRGGRHVATQGKSKGSVVRGGEAACRACHTPEHSRSFVFATAWPKIAHKEKP